MTKREGETGQMFRSDERKNQPCVSLSVWARAFKQTWFVCLFVCKDVWMYVFVYVNTYFCVCFFFLRLCVKMRKCVNVFKCVFV